MSHDDYITQFVPEQYKHLVKEDILVYPIELLYQGYTKHKSELIEKIQNSSNDQINSMHDYSSNHPFTEQQIIGMGNRAYGLMVSISKRYQDRFSQHIWPKFYVGFSITYDKSNNKKLKRHIDDSWITINLCLKNENVQGTIIKFGAKNHCINIPENYACIHFGDVPHETTPLVQGKRTNVVLWYT